MADRSETRPEPDGEERYTETDADERYTGLLVEITNALGEDFRLARELDIVVGERLCEAEDRGCPRTSAVEPRLIAAEDATRRLKEQADRIESMLADVKSMRGDALRKDDAPREIASSDG